MKLLHQDEMSAFQWAWREAPLLPCFAMAMLTGVAIISEQWDWEHIGYGVLALCLSAIALFRLVNLFNEKLVSKALAQAGAKGLNRDSWRVLARVQRIIFDGVGHLRVKERHLAEHQPRFDRRLAALIHTLARHSEHPLGKIAEQSLAPYAKQAEPISHISQGAAGGVMAQWRGHYVMLHVPSGQYGETQLSLCLTIDGEASASLYFDEGLHRDAAPMLARLKQMRVEALIYDSEPAEMLSCAARQLRTTIQANLSAAIRAEVMRRHTALEPKVMAFHLQQDGRFALTTCDGKGVWVSGRNIATFPAAIHCVRASRRARERSLMAVAGGHVFALGLIFAGSDWRMALLVAISLSALINLPIYWVLDQICGLEVAAKLKRQSALAAATAG